MCSVKILAGFPHWGDVFPEMVWNKSRNDDPHALVGVLISLCFWMTEQPFKTVSMAYATFIYVHYFFMVQSDWGKRETKKKFLPITPSSQTLKMTPSHQFGSIK